MATTATSNVELVEQMYADFNAGDIESVVASMAEDLTWIEPETEPHSPGTYHGPDAVVKEVFSIVEDEYEEFTVTADRFIDGGDTVVVEGRFVGKTKDGTSLDVPFAHVCDVRDGKLREFHNHTDTALLREAF